MNITVIFLSNYILTCMVIFFIWDYILWQILFILIRSYLLYSDFVLICWVVSDNGLLYNKLCFIFYLYLILGYYVFTVFCPTWMLLRVLLYVFCVTISQISRTLVCMRYKWKIKIDWLIDLTNDFNPWHVDHTVTGVSTVWKYWKSEWRSRVYIFPKYFKNFVLSKLCKLGGYLLLDKYVTWKYVCSNQQSKHNCKLHLHFVVFQHVLT